MGEMRCGGRRERERERKMDKSKGELMTEWRE